MKAPCFYLGSVLLFWGWQYEQLLVGTCLCLILEFLSFYEVRMDFKSSDFNRFVDAAIVFLAGAVVIALSTEAKKAIYFLVQWFPVIFFPIILSQQLSLTRKIDVRAFFLTGKRKINVRLNDPGKIDVSYIYALVCLLSSGMIKENGQIFYAASSFFFLWALFCIRPKRFHIGIWIVSMLLIFAAGYVSYKGMRYGRMKISRWMMAAWVDYYSANPFKNSLTIGDIGELKLSDKIVLRVAYPGKRPDHPVLIQNATYDTFAISNWYSRSVFKRILPKEEEYFWQIQPPVDNTGQMTIYSRLFKKRSVLHLPAGTVSISGMKPDICEKNAMQAVRIKGGPAYVKSVVSYTGKLSYDPDPEERDLFVSTKEKAVVRDLVSRLELEGKAPEEVLKSVKTYFIKNFDYSLELSGKGTYDTPLQNFLLHTKTGHCELFATATALMFRAVGIPARYTTGFIVHEYSRVEKRMIVRQRDAHAWVKVFINGRWINFDTTPPESLQADLKRSNPSFFLDLLSLAGFTLSWLRHDLGGELMEKYGLWLVLPLAVILFLRLRKAGMVQRIAKQDQEGGVRTEKIHESLFYDIEKLMTGKGVPKYPGETYNAWFHRISEYFEDSGDRGRFLSVISLYHKWRFSLSGLEKNEKNQFDAEVGVIIKQIGNLSISGKKF